MKGMTLNDREIESFGEWLKENVVGARLERVFIPLRKSTTIGYLKHEWGLRFRRRAFEGVLHLYLQGGQCGLWWTPTAPVAPHAPTSPFGEFLHRHLEGQILQSVEIHPGERWLTLHFTHHSLEVILIPNLPEAWLRLSGVTDPLIHSRLEPVRFRSRERKVDSSRGLRPELESSDWLTWGQKIEHFLEDQGFTQQREELIHRLKRDLQRNSESLRKTEQQLRTTSNSPDWAHFGHLVKTVFHEILAQERPVNPLVVEGQQIPWETNLSPTQNLERYFQRARRLKRQVEESKSRLNSLKEHQQVLTQLLERVGDLTADSEFPSALERMSDVPGFEILRQHAKSLGILRDPRGNVASQGPSSKPPQRKLKIGKQVLSAEGLVIIGGRNVDENLKITFQVAKGNDFWLHLRGHPSSHVCVLLGSRKTASLETLLDAAHFLLYLSDGMRLTQAEVEYTRRKFVKRIPGSKKVSYTQNKTLLVKPDGERVAALLQNCPT
jgi:predicted ribosome quality control (RQC) complex YloA/Tae2 family protein